MLIHESSLSQSVNRRQIRNESSAALMPKRSVTRRDDKET